MRIFVSKIMLVCFLAAAIVSKTDSAHATNTVEAIHINTTIILPDRITGSAVGATIGLGEHDGECACEAKSSKSASLVCGVVLALASEGGFAYVPRSVKTQLEWRNRFGPEFLQDRLKKPPRFKL